MTRKKLAVTLAAVIAAVVLLLGGTLAWQSIEQTALNEAAAIVNPGGRLHDDFDGENKDVYVENFADEPILVRVRLGEYLALTNNKGIAGAEHTNIMIGGVDANGGRVYETHLFGAYNRSDRYWTWSTGGSTVYMPTFNKNKDSLQADVNGTYPGPDGIVTDLPEDDRYTDHVVYSIGQTETGTEIHDADANMADEVGADLDRLQNYVTAGNVVLLEAEHTARSTLHAELVSLSEWLDRVGQDGGYDPAVHGGCWVYDTDGWVYWSAAVQPDTATGLLLDHIRLHRVMDDSWYYAIEVTAQFVTSDDIGKTDNTGFYDPMGGTAPSQDAETLLAFITGSLLNGRPQGEG